jgi:Family of unknown function (DUF5317)
MWLPAAAVAVRSRARERASAGVQGRPARADDRVVLIGLLFLACVASVPLAGGRLGQLASLTFRAPGLLVAAIAGQVLIVSVFPKVGSEALHATVHIGTYVVAALFVVANRRIPWVWLVALGGMLNFTAIAANGGVMPAAPGALEKAGFALDPAGFTNSGAVSHPHLQFLGDVFWVPSSFPVSNVFSVGDVLILVGALLAMHCICASRLAVRRFAVPAV